MAGEEDDKPKQDSAKNDDDNNNNDGKKTKGTMDFSRHVSQHNTLHHGDDDDDSDPSESCFGDDSFAMSESESALDTSDLQADGGMKESK